MLEPDAGKTMFCYGRGENLTFYAWEQHLLRFGKNNTWQTLYLTIRLCAQCQTLIS